MYEAHALAKLIAEKLTETGVKDSGAEFRIIVTDTAGNIATVFKNGKDPEYHQVSQWAWDEGFDEREHLVRLRIDSFLTRDAKRYRWLRDRFQKMDVRMDGTSGFHLSASWLGRARSLDEAIDNTMKDIP